ncbi:hypothetical protein CASFOL_035356 [Castilleja foliolosa]|uniref:GATA-type domain-containing protein n=1 Tax=Castilleja foliolosa TaxID=1961234 RepID=A0ABD3BT40_9LAMI
MDKKKGKTIDLDLKLGPSNPDQDPPNYQNPPNQVINGTRVCRTCGVTNTCLWRKGPAGPQTLCNACGLKFMRAQRRAS